MNQTSAAPAASASHSGKVTVRFMSSELYPPVPSCHRYSWTMTIMPHSCGSPR